MAPELMGWSEQINAVLPELLLTGYGFLVLLLAAMLRHEGRRFLGYLSLLCVAITLLLVVRLGFLLPPSGVRAFGGLFALDVYSVFLKAVFLVAGLLTLMLSLRYLDREGEEPGEFYALVLLALVGMMFMASARDLVLVFVSLETMSLCSYLLVGYLQRDRRSNEAALKYFVLGAFSSGVFAFGASLVYGATGSTDLEQIARMSTEPASQGILMLGLVLLMVSLGFKVAAVPFHMWVPDVYQGAPTPITAFLSTASKAAAFAIFVRIFAEGFLPMADRWVGLLAFVSLASMTVGNVAAVLQDNMKRMLAYSSIAHAGYILMGLLAIGKGGEVGSFGLTAVLLYLLIYTFMNMGAFGYVVLLRREGIAGEGIRDFAGMSRRAPVAAAGMLVLMLSLAGIPATAGFIGKWYLFGAALRADFAWLAVAAVVNSAISLYYYLRVVVFMYIQPAQEEAAYGASPLLVGALAVSVVLTLAIGCYPQPFIDLARAAFLQ